MSRRLDATLLNNQTAVSTVGAVTPLANAEQHAFTIDWGLGTSAGAVTIEAAPHKDYAGTWAVLMTVSWPAANQCDLARFTGAFKALRARISTGITTADKGVTVSYSSIG